ncbi:hypothetical protein AGOR_G00210360 [Albula goreensis]|uniref:C-type lectin domain-containing protein n=1 Tax=Albula goreensis TaxID=1534307 RepID=A0A8T3CR96_9TELE|nr:hypothetical protein AGOR_G00210360 [Albula goreensis]
MGKAVPHMLPYTLSISQTSTTMRNRANMFPFLIISGLCTLVSGLPPHYHFVNDRKNWTDAQKYCREMYSDLATIYDKVDIDHLTETVQNGKAWIGLERGDLLKWHWSLANRDFYKDGDLIFRNWKNGEPSTDGGKESCAVMHPSGKWSDEDCNSKRPFICLKGKNNSEKGFILITENKAWREAQTFCRETHTDLTALGDGMTSDASAKGLSSVKVKRSPKALCQPVRV